MPPDRDNRFVDRILEWYDSSGRHEFPWRASDASPFEVLVAELMLQQTSVEHVMNVYPEFVQRYWTPDAVVDTAATKLAEDIQPSACASAFSTSQGSASDSMGSTTVVSRTSGPIARLTRLAPCSRTLTGKPAVDTNVERVLSRVFESEVSDDPTEYDVQRVADQLAPEGSCSDFTHALIDFGGEVCIATNPICADCGVHDVCDYYEREEG